MLAGKQLLLVVMVDVGRKVLQLNWLVQVAAWLLLKLILFCTLGKLQMDGFEVKKMIDAVKAVGITIVTALVDVVIWLQKGISAMKDKSHRL